jgi:hypothetical protein
MKSIIVRDVGIERHNIHRNQECIIREILDILYLIEKRSSISFILLRKSVLVFLPMGLMFFSTVREMFSVSVPIAETIGRPGLPLLCILGSVQER